MKKLLFRIFLCSMGICLFAGSGYADLELLSEGDLKHTVAQAGISISLEDKILIDLKKGMVAYCDEDGTDGRPGYLSLNNMSLNGSFSLPNPVQVDVTTEQCPYTGMMTTGINITMNDVQLDINRWNIESITVGENLGCGNSFGGIAFTGSHHISISGKLRITAH